MGDINWDKVEVRKMATRKSPAHRLLKALQLRKRKKHMKELVRDARAGSA